MLPLRSWDPQVDPVNQAGEDLPYQRASWEAEVLGMRKRTQPRWRLKQWRETALSSLVQGNECVV